jgi:hypothetical protein
MASKQSTVDFIVEQMTGAGTVTARKMYFLLLLGLYRASEHHRRQPTSWFDIDFPWIGLVSGVMLMAFSYRALPN